LKLQVPLLRKPSMKVMGIKMMIMKMKK
jgi:hypothetical protein